MFKLQRISLPFINQLIFLIIHLICVYFGLKYIIRAAQTPGETRTVRGLLRALSKFRYFVV